nr:DUF4810 domain-containing protein [uncultured Tolumonas sp.]
MNFSGLKKAVIVSGIILMSACSSGPKPLYNWQAYQPNVYDYFRTDGSSTDEQIHALEVNIQEAAAKSTAVPPGMHAHLGLLYAKAGRQGQAQEQFGIEKQLFPESASFMDFLLTKNKGALK